MTDPDDEMREILGDEVFEELNSIEVPEIPENLRELLEEHARMELEDIEIEEYLTIPIPVEYASFIVQSAIHASLEDCDKCEKEIGVFMGLVINTLRETLEEGGFYPDE